MKNKIKNWKLGSIIEKLMQNPIELLEESHHLAQEDLIGKFPGKTIYACDFYVSGMEKGVLENGVLRLDNIISIDHHAPINEFMGKISSVNLAIRRVREKGIAPMDSVVAINHTDFDSIVSGCIMRGIFPPDQFLGELAIAADHTGESEEVVDLLQSMSEVHDLEFSIRNLQLWLDGKPLEEKAEKMLERLIDERRRAKEAVDKGLFRNVGGVYYARLRQKIESAYFPSLLPEAMIILIFSPHRKYEGLWEAKTRLGNFAPKGLCLNALGICDFDPAWGGRWNAGSNRRGKGRQIPIEEYARMLNSKLEKFLEKACK